MTLNIRPTRKNQRAQSTLIQANGRIPSVTILGVQVHAVTMRQVLEIIKDMAASGSHHQVATVNPEFIMVAQRHNEFRNVLNNTSLSFADGIGVVWASRILGQPLPERIPGVEVVERLSGLAAEVGFSVFLLGAAPGIADEAARRLQRRYPKLVVAGTFAGSPKPEDDEAICEIVKKAHPDMLFVAYGAPNQDLWIARNQARLGIAVAMGVGGTFDFIVGKSIRAPKVLRSLGFEWLHRLIREPRRWKRMLALPRFAFAVLWRKLE